MKLKNYTWTPKGPIVRNKNYTKRNEWLAQSIFRIKEWRYTLIFLLIFLLNVTKIYTYANSQIPIKIAFVIYELSFRGMELATYDYAHYNETLLGNKSYIINFDAHTDNQVRTKFKSRFGDRLFDCESIEEMHYVLQEHKIDILYALKHSYDNIISTTCPTAVHTVFPTRLKPHGDMFACISPWLCSLFPQYKPAYVPHIVQVGETKEDMRHELNIPNNAIVFGRYGGDSSFNIPCAIQAVKEVAKQQPDIYFIFLNTKEFCDLPNVKFLPKTTDLEYKTKFINSCDALLHARWRGETFGLTCAEFSMKNKPVISWKHSPEKAHIDFLGKTGIYYGNKEELVTILLNFKKGPDKNWDVYSKQFTPERVMKQFEAIFIKPLLKRKYLYDKKELKAHKVVIEKNNKQELNPEFMAHLKELLEMDDSDHTIFWINCESEKNISSCIPKIDNPKSVLIFSNIHRIEENPSQENAEATLDYLYQTLINKKYQIACIADNLVAYKNSNIRQSTLIQAMTMSRLSDCQSFAQDLTIDKLLAAEKWIGKTEKSMQKLWENFELDAQTQNNFSSRHYRLWHALGLFYNQEYEQAAEAFETLLTQGYIHWRVYWYYAQTLYYLSDPRTAIMIDQVLKFVPQFYPALLFRNQNSS
ncbi:MAG TPA: hypothetical protein VJ201_04205 [Candidatus Babeliales bacterium]|nr:hypothetical protein [Candidatus Babeliales bacterium]